MRKAKIIPGALLLASMLAAPGAAGAEVDPTAGSVAAPAAAPREPPLPTDEDLERSGAVIGEIRIFAGNVFDPLDPAENRRLFKIANRLHWITREKVIRRQLLFRPGDAFSRRVLEESERLLRDNRYLHEVSIQPVRYDDQRVDVEILTRDVWTLVPTISFSRKGGVDSTRFELLDSNFLGSGKDLRLLHKKNIDRTSSSLRYRDSNLLGGRGRLELEYTDSDDGDLRSLHLWRPFFSLDSRWAASFQALSFDRIDTLYERGEITAHFRHSQTHFEVSGGYSRGLLDGQTSRWRIGATFLRDRFSPADELPGPMPLPEDRELVYPWIAFESVTDRYVELENLDLIGRTEDLALGRRLSARLGWSTDLFGGDGERLIYAGTYEQGWSRQEGRTLLLSAGLSGRWGEEGIENLLAGAEVRYYRRNFGRHILFGRLKVDGSHRQDGETQLLLGGDSGLRGYPLRFLDGDRRILINLEQRFYTDWQPLRLVNVGAAIFFDAGWAGFAASEDSRRVLTDVGAGLRLGLTRSGRGKLIHLDLAIPLDADPSIESLQWLISTRETF